MSGVRKVHPLPRVMSIVVHWVSLAGSWRPRCSHERKAAASLSVTHVTNCHVQGGRASLEDSICNPQTSMVRKQCTYKDIKWILGKLGPGQLGPGQLGPGAQFA